MSGVIDPVLKARALQELSRRLPPDAKNQATLFWENDHGTAGVTLTNDGCTVFLFDGEERVESLVDAEDLLKKIFADEIIVIRAYADEVFVYGGLAPASDPSAGFNSLVLGGSRSKSMPDIDYVSKATWSRGYVDDDE